jgi:predicted CoA-binding protein
VKRQPHSATILKRWRGEESPSVLRRRGCQLPEIVESAIAIQAATLWTQLKIYHPVAEKKAIEAGLNVIMDACIQIEYQRLFA